MVRIPTCLLLACGLTSLITVLPTSSASAAAPKKLRVAVMPFDSTSKNPEYAALGKGLQAMITTDLNAVGSYDLVERSRLAEIQSELKLSTTGAIDTKTAAKIGKLAGATHLVAGAVTILGDKMRIDARMFSVQTGKILLTEQISGAKDEFFDLPKQLVKKMVGATGVKMTPKVRVKVSRIHTADFKAFRTYSDGIQAYDAKDFKKSVKLLKLAAKIDPDFKLADLTLADYEEKIAQMQTLAVDTEVNKRKAAEIKRNALAQKVATKMKGYWATARKTGKEHALARTYALFKLYRMYDNGYSNMRGLFTYEDRFETERIADALAAQFFAEAQKLFPKIPIAPTRHAHWNWTRIPKGDSDQRRLERVTLDARQDWRRMCQRLQLDAKGCGQFLVKAVAKLQKAGADREDLADVLIKAGRVFRHALAVDASTIAFSDAQKLTKVPYTSKSMVEEVQGNKQVKLFLKQCKNPYARELLMLNGWNDKFKFKGCNNNTARDVPDPLGLIGANAVSAARKIPRKSHMMVGDMPVWVFGSRDVYTGPRTDLYRAESLVYYEAKPKKYGVLTMFDGRKASKVSVGLETSYAPPKSWYPQRDAYRPRKDQTEVKYTATKPRMVLGVGLVDVDVEMHNHLKTGNRYVARPTYGYGVMLDGNGVHLVEIREDTAKAREIVRTNDYRNLYIAWKRLNFKVLSSKKSSVQGKSGKLKWKVSASGKTLKGSIGGKSFSFSLPKPLEKGYTGLWIDGPGYAQFGKISVK